MYVNINIVFKFDNFWGGDFITIEPNSFIRKIRNEGKKNTKRFTRKSFPQGDCDGAVKCNVVWHLVEGDVFPTSKGNCSWITKETSVLRCCWPEIVEFRRTHFKNEQNSLHVDHMYLKRRVLLPWIFHRFFSSSFINVLPLESHDDGR